MKNKQIFEIYKNLNDLVSLLKQNNKNCFMNNLLTLFSSPKMR